MPDNAKRIVVNSSSNGKFREELINNRPHLVTTMISLEGDSVMNRLFYPLEEVVKSFSSINMLPAPAAHPEVNGVKISASSPIAANANNIGAFALNPRMDGNLVVNDLAIDMEVAEKDERGKEALRRIRAGEKIGVSTGLVGPITNTSGSHNGHPYDGIITNYKFDHVAILLDETPGGDKTFTVNSLDTDVIVCNVDISAYMLNEAVDRALNERFNTGEGDSLWVREIFLGSKTAIYRDYGTGKLLRVHFSIDFDGEASIIGDPVEVIEKRTFEPVVNPANNNNAKETEMDKEKLIPLIIANSANSFTASDKGRLLSMSEDELVPAIHSNLVVNATIEQATKVVEDAGLTVNSKDFDADGYKAYGEKKAQFDAYMQTVDDARKKTIDNIVTNSKMSAEDLGGMNDDALERIAQSLAPTQDYSAQAGIISNYSDGHTAVDYS